MNRLKTIKTEEILTGGKTRQKRNGPGGSGCFHAFCYFLARPAQGFARRRPAGAVLVHDSPQTLALSSTSTTSLGPKAPPASRTWCFTPRKPLLFRRRAPRLWGQRRRRRAGRGASLPANPCSFVDEHHVFGAKGAAGISSHQYKSQKERIDDGTSVESVPSSISTDFNRNSRN